MIVPGLYGYVSATKWVTRLTLTTFARQQAYWTQRGYADQAPIKTESRIDVPRPLAQVKAGPVTGGRGGLGAAPGIAAVEVSVDDGPWQPARLAAADGIDTWRQWGGTGTPPPACTRCGCGPPTGTGATQTPRGPARSQRRQRLGLGRGDRHLTAPHPRRMSITPKQVSYTIQGDHHEVPPPRRHRHRRRPRPRRPPRAARPRPPRPRPAASSSSSAMASASSPMASASAGYRRQGLRPGLRVGADVGRGQLHRHGHRAGGHRRVRQPGAVHAGHRGQEGRPGRHAQLRGRTSPCSRRTTPRSPRSRGHPEQGAGRQGRADQDPHLPRGRPAATRPSELARACRSRRWKAARSPRP